MIISKLIGGLGNQMFQYAAGRSLADKNNTLLKLDISEFEDYKLWPYSLRHFNITENLASRKEINKLTRPHPTLSEMISNAVFHRPLSKNPSLIEENGLQFHKEVLELGDNVYLDGYWQSENYFLPIEGIIRNEFTLKSSPAGINFQHLEQIRNANSISIHIRRGDFVTDPRTNAAHGLCSLEYYKKSIEYIADHVAAPHFFMFSDDIKWASENIKIPFETSFVDNNDKHHGYEDLRLMSNCKHNIVANSSFGWWGAWLNNNKNKIVIAPKKWFQSVYNDKDVVPDKWLRF